MKIKLSLVFTISTVLLLIVGLGMTFATSFMLNNFGHDVVPGTLHFARAAGGALIGLAVITWLARNAGPSKARDAITAGLATFFLLEAIVDFRAILNGTYGNDAWFTGVIPWLIMLVLTVLAARGAMVEE